MKDGGSAFPIDRPVYARHGMSLRDYFAAKAMPMAIQHLLATRESQINPGPFLYESVAAEAYRVADAMLAEREKEQP